MKTIPIFILCFCFFASTAKEQYPGFFLENRGQVTDQNGESRNDIQFSATSKSVSVFIGRGTMHYQWHRPGGVPAADGSIDIYRMDVSLTGCNEHSEIITEDKQAYYEQYFTSSCRNNGGHINSFKKVTYLNIYPDIDWVLYFKGDELEQEFIVRNGADPKLIQLKYDGALPVTINNDGTLTALTPMGKVDEKKPYCYTTDGNEIPSQYHLENNVLSFDIGSYDGTLIIDPTLTWATYYGGSSFDQSTDVTVDRYSNIYMSGKTSSLNNIATVGSHQSVYSGGIYDAFLVKFDSSGNRLWATYYGGPANDYAMSVATDDTGNVFMSGYTRSYSGISTVGCHQPLLAADTGNAFLAKFDSAGSRIWSTYYGGEFYSYGNQPITCDDSGNVFLSGTTGSTYNITTPGSFKENHVNPGFWPDDEGYIVKFNGSGVRQWATYYGLDGTTDKLNAICTDADANVYIIGETSSLTGITTPGSFQENSGGGSDAFVVKFSGGGDRIWGTYYGGSFQEFGRGIACNESTLYIGGITQSTGGISTPGVHQETLNNSSQDTFVARFDTAGNRAWGSYFGGPAQDISLTGNMLATDPNNNVFICGSTYSDDGIALPGAHQLKRLSVHYDAFITKFNPAGMAEWSTYYGGCGVEQPYGIATDNSGNTYLSGITSSMGNISTQGSFQETGTMSDGFLSKFTNIPTPPDTISRDTSLCDGGIVTFTVSPVFWAESYTWILPNGWPGSSSTNTINTTVAVPGGDIMVIAHKECSNDTLPLLHVTVHPLPQPVITHTNTTLSTGNFTQYQWYYEHVLIPGATNQIHNATLNGSYYVIVTDDNGCSNSSDTVTVTSVGIDERHSLARIELFPNPNDRDFVIAGENNGISRDSRIYVTIHDAVGKLVFNSTYDLHNEKFTIPIQLPANCPSGLYTIKVMSDEHYWLDRFIVR